MDWGPHVNILSDVLSSFEYGVSQVPTPRAEHLQIVNHPNPFNPATVVAYTIPGPGHLEISIYDVAGRRVVTLLDREVKTSGSISWDGADDTGQRAASGVYFCKARFGDQTAIQKIMMIK